ncbi:MAG: nitroreductase/quinone reductase family protein [Chloroflexi bacterium]|nr:nitroreductase/quinone reductase family protein [Chloroflexota bacterium]
MDIKTINWKRIKTVQKLHRFLYSIGFGPILGHLILLLTTIGRKSGKKRITPLQYEIIENKYVFGAARGAQADWVQNILKNPLVEIQVKNLRLTGFAEVNTDPGRVADFLETRLTRHPFMMGLLMEKIHHLPRRPSRAQLLELASKEVIVLITISEGA